MERSSGRCGYLDLGLGGDARKVHRKTNCLVRVGVGRSDGCHESNPSSQTITKVPSACRIKTVFYDGHRQMRQGSLEPQYHIEDSTGTLGRSSLVTSVSRWQYRGMSPERNKNVVQPGTFIVMCERVRFIWASNTTCVLVFPSVKSLCRAEPIT